MASVTPGTAAKRGAINSSVTSKSALRSTSPPSTLIIMTKVLQLDVSEPLTLSDVPSGCSRSIAAAMRRSSSSRTLMSTPRSKSTWKLPPAPRIDALVSSTIGNAATRASSGNRISRSTASDSLPGLEKLTHSRSPSTLGKSSTGIRCIATRPIMTNARNAMATATGRRTGRSRRFTVRACAGGRPHCRPGGRCRAARGAIRWSRPRCRR